MKKRETGAQLERKLSRQMRATLKEVKRLDKAWGRYAVFMVIGQWFLDGDISIAGREAWKKKDAQFWRKRRKSRKA